MSVESLITKHIDIWTSAVQTKSTAGRGTSSKLDLYGIKKLRELILELAVRGKLVPQDPNDEPASVLLEKIEKEKALLVKEKKITKPKKPPKISDDELHYPIPEGWVVRWLPDIYYCISPSGKKLKSSDISDEGTYPVIDQGQEFISGYSDEEDHLILVDTPVVIFGDHTRNIKFVDFSFIPGADGTKILCPLVISPRYFYIAINSYDLESRGYGRHFKILNDNKILIPPLSEQHRIVAKVDELMKLCDQLEQQTEASITAHQVLVETLLATLTNSSNAEELMENWQRISAHFDTLFTTEESIDQLKQTILQLAVMGKLVPQNPADEPASELLKRIAKEKAQLVKEKKIKKQKALPPITDDEKPFELPDGWEWCRFSEAIDVRDGTHDSPKDAEGEDTFPLVTSKNFVNGDIDFENARRISAQDHFEIVKRSDVSKYDILFSMIGGNIGNQVMVKDDRQFSIKNVALFKYYDKELTSPDFVFLFTQNLANTLQDSASGGAQPFVSLGVLRNLLFPIPPVEEQKRIVAKIAELIEICEQLQASIKDAQTTQLHLTDAIIEQVI